MWYLTIHHWTGEPSNDEDLLAAHLAWNRAHHERGRILFSGPGDEGRVGIIVFSAHDLDRGALTELCASEPFLAAGLRRMEVIDWVPRQVLGSGAFTLEELRLAGGGPPRREGER
jgi:uncharacterized protein YciI